MITSIKIWFLQLSEAQTVCLIDTHLIEKLGNYELTDHLLLAQIGNCVKSKIVLRQKKICLFTKVVFKYGIKQLTHLY